MTADPLAAFSPATRHWFARAFTAPTAAQAGAWEAIARGDNALVVAPTGSGKTLSAFLWALDRLATRPVPEDAKARCRVLYVSPLKALAYDVERNLRRPLDGIRAIADAEGLPAPHVTVGMRTGDTPASERRAFTRTPPDILITTPESLFLLLTSAARESLRSVETVIVDEVHAVCGTKRGAHLALTLERLDALLERPAQRVGLSATVRPIERAAEFLGGAAPVTVVRPPSAKTIEVTVEVPIPDLTDIPPDEDGRKGTVWPAVERRLLDLIRAHSATIVFVNGRGLAERLCGRLNELAAEILAPTAIPGQMTAQSPVAAGVAPTVARAHHGSMSREERRYVEEALKSGALPAVVATSSLELGIDMGAVDLVVQIGSPPSVASGLQRVGRAGHQVGAVSKGVVMPTHPHDLLVSAVVAERMGAGALEEMTGPKHPLDVLAQQIVAMTAMDPWPVARLAATVRRASMYRELPEPALTAVLDMLAGRYPSTGFADLRPRLVWDRRTDVLTGREGAQRLAVTSGGTIPDRGLYPVSLVDGGRGSRVGELDEEMVYESRAGDVFVLGASTWRIEEITPDRVLVTPAPGQPARMPFWKGEDPGRPVELGRAIGRRLREDAGVWPELDAFATANLSSYLSSQREATGSVPDDRTVVVERFRDELGDWRLAVHSVLGKPVNGPWALAIAARAAERYKVDAQILPTDDGVMLRLPDMPEPPGADLVVFDPGEISAMVTGQLANSALFSARFRECAARSLLMPRRDPRRRQPLWQQRQRAAQLFGVAREFEDFPVTAEAARECVEDFFDLPALTGLMRELGNRTTRLVEVETKRPSPFARSLLFAYVAGNLYSEDTPIAERCANALAVDSSLLAELLGEVDHTELLDPAVVAEAAGWLQWTGADRLRDAEDVVELLRVVGDLSDEELAARGAAPGWAEELSCAGRVARWGGRWILAEDAGRYAQALGASFEGLPAAFLAPVADAWGDLVSRYARTHTPFTAAGAAERFGVPVATVEPVLRRLNAAGSVEHGRFTADEPQWCDVEVLRLLKRRSLAALRAEIAPVPATAYARFLPAWQGVGEEAVGVDAVAAAVEQLQGQPVPASALERLVLPARVGDYTPVYLDELTSSGELLWAGAGALTGNDGWITLAYADTAELLLPEPNPEALSTELHEAVLEALGQARFFRDLAETVDAEDDDTLVAVLWDLVWSGWITNDSLAPLRTLLSGAGAHKSRPAPPRSRRARPARFRLGTSARTSPPTAAGRWQRLPAPDTDPTRRLHARAATALDRHGVLVKDTTVGLYPVLSAMEDRGAVRRGYFVAGLGAAQFAEPGAVDRLRSCAGPGTGDVVVLAATDPANPFGAGLGWPDPHETVADGTGGHRPGRRAGALVVLVDGEAALYVERGGRTMLSFTREERTLDAAARGLVETVRRAGLGALAVERGDGVPVTGTPLGAALAAAGFRETHRGLRLG
ncbi:ATP-dependent helicase [Actinorhabdospora filicis]|uniref:ATP-dependent helicase n=1 Tax=Actinorhabdospora filicis TaxID=1785913 RepID=A0A9W6W4A9_9ACTN|nr:DEAD/DEAH box helicase [Actinorhabdospora filicis]GLZ79072.1 ATP-dependent helicase [Actinorhabdospora filicis]